MKKKQATGPMKALLVLLVWAGATAVQGENVFQDDFAGDGDKARFVIEAEHYSFRSHPTTEGWWEVDGVSHKFIEGPSEGEQSPLAEKLHSGEGNDIIRDLNGKETRARERISSSDLLDNTIGINRNTRGNYMVVKGVSVYPIAPTGGSYDGAFIDYRVAVETPGEYRLYTRWLGLDKNTDSLYIYLIAPDGTVLKGAGPDYIILHQYTSGWRWVSSGVENSPYSSQGGSSGQAIWKIAKPGEYTIRVAEREFDTAVDALVFQTTDLPKPDDSELAESRYVDKPVENRELIAIRSQLLTALEQRRQAMQSIEEAVARETLMHAALEDLLAGGEYGELNRWNITEAKQKVDRMINIEERSRDALGRAIEQLEGALQVLGWTPPPPPKRIAYWSFDEGGGTSANDSEGNNNGKIHGAKWTDGMFGNALMFDGVDDYVEVPDDPSLRFMQSGSFTISAWVMPDSNMENGQVICKMRAARKSAKPKYDDLRGSSITREVSSLVARKQIGVFGYHIGWISAQSGFAFSAESSWKGAVSAKTGNYSAPAGKWYHVVGVYSDKDMKVYLNGELKDRRTFDLNTGSTTPDKNLVIGAISYDSKLDRFFGGMIDEVSIFDGALSDSEIRALYRGDL